MPPTTFSIFGGDARTLFLKVINDACCGGGPLDLTTCTEIVINLPNQDGTYAQLKLSMEQVTITDPPVLGAFSAPISSQISALLNIGTFQDIDVTFTIGDVFTVRYAKALSVLEIR